MTPNLGDRVYVRPVAGLLVQVSGMFGRFLPGEGQEVSWDEHWQARLSEGAISISTPAQNLKEKK